MKKINFILNKNFWLSFLSSFLLIALLGFMVNLLSFSGEKIPAAENDYIDDFTEKYAVFAIDFPRDLSFAGEKVPLENFDVHENLDREFLVNTYWHSQSFLFIKRAYRYFPVIDQILKQNGIPADFKYLCVAESGLTNSVSPAGATGFWQFMKATAIKYKLEINDEIDERYNLVKSTRAACKYLKDSYSVYKNWALVAASYNAGMGNIDNQLKKQKVNSYYDLLLNEETSRYVFRIIAIKTIMENPRQFGFRYRTKDLYPPLAYTEVEIDTTISDLTEFALLNNINYKILKYFNPWLRQNSLTINDGKKYTILIPKPGSRELEKLWLEADTAAAVADTLN